MSVVDVDTDPYRKCLRNEGEMCINHLKSGWLTEIHQIRLIANICRVKTQLKGPRNTVLEPARALCMRSRA